MHTQMNINKTGVLSLVTNDLFHDTPVLAIDNSTFEFDSDMKALKDCLSANGVSLHPGILKQDYSFIPVSKETGMNICSQMHDSGISLMLFQNGALITKN